MRNHLLSLIFNSCYFKLFFISLKGSNSRVQQHATSFAMKTCMYVPSLLSSVAILNQQGSIHNMLQSISTALCTVNGELCADDQPLVSGEKPGKSSHAASKSTQTFKIDVFTEEVFHCIACVQPPLPSDFFEGRGICTQAIHCNATVLIIQL